MRRFVTSSSPWVGRQIFVWIVITLLHPAIEHVGFQSVESFSAIGWLLPPKLSNSQRGQSHGFNRISLVKEHGSPSYLAALISTSTSFENQNGESRDDISTDARLRLALAKHFDPNRISRPQPFENRTYVYDVREVYGGEENLPYWYRNSRLTRFQSSALYGTLYRPEIVDDIMYKVNENLNLSWPEGIFVTGPQNIGKSYSLVNTVIHLESNRDYLITFIPDCQRWTNSYQLIEAIFKSFGSDGVSFGINDFPAMTTLQIEVETEKLIDKIDSILASLDGGKKWIFIFDQINKILKRPIVNSGMIGDLPYPYSLITSVIKSQRILSVISASANNEATLDENQEGFVQYNHKTSMSRQEVETVFFYNQNITNTKVKTLIDTTMELTGGVPGYTYLFVDKFNGNIIDFEGYIRKQVETSHCKLIKASSVQEWDETKNSIVTSILGMNTMNSRYYDRQYFIQEEVEGFFRYHALIPTVTDACRSLLFEDLLAYVNKKEAELLKLCRDTDDDSVKGSFFEYIVISRMKSKKIVFDLVEGKIFRSNTKKAVLYLQSNKFPDSSSLSEDGIYVPISKNFPAIDVILKRDKTIIGVQIHIGRKTQDDIDRFAKLSQEADWDESFDEIYLMYLSPTKDTTSSIKTLISKVNSSMLFSTIALDISCVQGLNDLNWPTPKK
jgi:hypothetical protein